MFQSPRRSRWRLRGEVVTVRKTSEREKSVRKNFGAKTWLSPMPALIIGTYDENGTPDTKKHDPIIYDGVTYAYRSFGEKVGKAFSNGKTIK